MKKVAAAVLVLALITLSTVGSFSNAAGIVSRGNATGQLKDVKYSSDGSSEAVVITARDYVDYSVMELSEPRRIVLDIYNVTAPGKQQIIQTDGKIIKRIRYAQFDTYTARVVLELGSEAEYGVEKTDTGVVLYIGEKPESTGKDETEVPPAQTVTPSAIKQTLTVHSKFKIQYAPGENGEEVTMLLSSYNKYKVTRLTVPDRLVISIPDAQYTGADKSVKVNGNQIKTIQYTKFGKSGATITLSLNAQSQYSIKEAKGSLLLTVQPPTYRNIQYYNNSDRVHFILKDAVLTEGAEFLKDLYTGTYDESGKEYSVIFPTGEADLGNGVMGINDSYLQSAEVITNPEEGTTRLVFKSNTRLEYLVFTRNPGTTSITVMKPATQKEKLVVIDAGHGGVATGAIYKTLLEKDLNLDIAKRLNTLLEKKGVKTYMLREDDSDIANYERAYIANKLNASLYLSIHNNAMDDKNFSGTMTLYCPSTSSGFSGRSFADIIHQQLLSKLKTVDRKVKERPDLIVLKATNMPAALAEVAFMTNSKDRSNLQKSAFRQKAAQALCDSVVKALAKMK